MDANRIFRFTFNLIAFFTWIVLLLMVSSAFPLWISSFWLCILKFLGNGKNPGCKAVTPQ